MRLRLKPSKKLVLAGLCLLSVVLMLVRDARQLRWVVRPVLLPLSEAGIIVPVTFRTRIDEMTGAGHGAGDERVAALRDLLLSQQQIIRSQQETINALTGWRNNRWMRGFKCKLVEAKILGAEAISMRDRKLLGAGRDRGLAPGQIVTTRRLAHELDVALPEKLLVLGSSHVVGRIIDCAAFSATLQLVTDGGFEMPAALLRTVGPAQTRTFYVKGPGGQRREVIRRHDGKTPHRHTVGPAIAVQAKGNGRDIVLQSVPAEHGVEPGDVLISSESTQLLPFGLQIGAVTRTEPDKTDAHFVTVYVKPSADFQSLRDVYIVVPLAK